MRFYTPQHKVYGGIDLHARTLYVCLLSQDGEIRWHRDMQASPETCLKTMAPSREDIVVAVECIVPWSWLADLCAQEGLPCVLGHALDMQAMHGGKAKNDTIDAHKIAVLLRGRMLPPADVDPAAMQATRDLLRRRMYLMHTRAELLTHVQQTNWQDHLPEIGKTLADQGHRTGGAERCPDPAVQNSIAVDLAWIASYDRVLRELAWAITHTAKQHDAKTWSRLPTVPGLGKMLRLVWRDALPDLHRVPRGQDVVSWVGWSKGRKTLPASAMARRARRLATPLGKGLCPKPPCSSCGSIRRGQHLAPVWRKNMAAATR